MENDIITKNDGQGVRQWSHAGSFNGTKSNETSTTASASNGNIIGQANSPQDLDLVSWPPNKILPSFGRMDGYYYDVTNGIDKYVYVIDYGIDPGNPVSALVV